MLNTIEMPNEKYIQKWCEALRSGEYAQTTGQLQNEKGYCCLGVACKLFSPNHPLKLDGTLTGGLPSAAAWKDPEWLEEISSNFTSIVGDFELTVLNDSGIQDPESLQKLERFTFDEIADLLEAVFVLKVLE